MTEAELAELLTDCPILYHMAERGSWASIEQRGLLSTTALLDLYGVAGARRSALERARRPDTVELLAPGLPRAVLRDQKPMDDKGLTRALTGGLLPADWYSLLNSKVFFWLTRERLLRLLGAGPYRELEHDVLEVRSEPLVAQYRAKICFCPMNSGNTKPFPHPRGVDTFRRIENYPYAEWRAKRKAGERVVELAVDGGVPNIRDFVSRAVVMCGNEERQVLLRR